MRNFLSPILTIFIMALVAGSADAATGFNTHFEIRRDSAKQAEWLMIRARPLQEASRLGSAVKQELKRIQQLSGTDFDREMSGFTESNGLTHIQTAQFRTALRTMRGLNLDTLFASAKLKILYGEIDREIDATARGLVNPFNVVGNMADPYYFYKGAVIEAVIKKLLSYAEKLFFDNAPVLAVAHFVLSRIEGWLDQRQKYYRHLALYYISNFSPEELGLTAAETRWLLSSIYSSGLGWKDILEANQIALAWNTFGPNELKGAINSAKSTWNTYQSTWASDFGGMGYGFEHIQSASGSERIVNLQVKRSKYFGSPSVSWDYARPERIRNERVLLMGAEFGAHFVPFLVGPIKSELLKFIRSFYAPQIPTEGALFGYFVAQGEADQAKRIADQSINPLLLLELAQ